MAQKRGFMKTIFSLLLLVFSCVFAHAEVIGQWDKGTLEKSQGQLVLHVKGSPYERGYQHGKLLKEKVQESLTLLIGNQKKEAPENKERLTAFMQNLPKLKGFVPERFMEEMRGVADGAEVPFEKIVLLNLFPELFHCSGITACGDATVEGALYHVRVLDYAVGKGIQKNAVLMVAEPEQGFPFLNVTYAGFIGSVTGMNSQKVAVGEIGGKGYGSWDGMPMTFLIRNILEEAATLDDAKALLENSPRTCEYFYVLSDGKDDRSVGVYATHDTIAFYEKGTSYQLNDLTFEQPQECIVMTGLCYPERHALILERIKEAYGALNASVLQEIIKRPVARESNLHNALFLPAALKVWISHAGPDGEPACDEPYALFCLSDFLTEVEK